MSLSTRYAFFAALILFLASVVPPAWARIGYGTPGVDDATTLWPGTWEIKSGIEAGSGYKLEGSKIDAIRVPLSLRYGWQERLEAGFEVPFAFQKSRNPKFDGSGISDISFSLKYQMSQDEGNAPASATEVRIGYGANNVVASHALSLGLFYSLSKSFEDGHSAGHMNLGYTLFTQTRPDVFNWGLSYERRLKDTLRGSVGVNSGSQIIPGVKGDVMAELGIMQEINPALEAFISGGLGLTRQSPSWQLRLGATKEFGRSAGLATPYRKAEWNRPAGPGVPEIINKGELAAGAGDYELAVSYYREAIVRDSGVASAWNNMGIVLFKLGRTRESLEAYEIAAKLDRSNADIYFNMGLAHYKLGDILSARRAFARALEINPGHALARSNLLSLEGRTGAR